VIEGPPAHLPVMGFGQVAAHVVEAACAAAPAVSAADVDAAADVEAQDADADEHHQYETNRTHR